MALLFVASSNVHAEDTPTANIMASASKPVYYGIQDDSQNYPLAYSYTKTDFVDYVQLSDGWVDASGNYTCDTSKTSKTLYLVYKNFLVPGSTTGTKNKYVVTVESPVNSPWYRSWGYYSAVRISSGWTTDYRNSVADTNKPSTQIWYMYREIFNQAHESGSYSTYGVKRDRKYVYSTADWSTYNSNKCKVTSGSRVELSRGYVSVVSTGSTPQMNYVPDKSYSKKTLKQATKKKFLKYTTYWSPASYDISTDVSDYYAGSCTAVDLGPKTTYNQTLYNTSTSVGKHYTAAKQYSISYNGRKNLGYED
ncbi:hypothetical protein JD969_19565 [Planctomycetota bacterium]|nr:hypothetical protein JD969_19565 [Planctomycetota bacterium]